MDEKAIKQALIKRHVKDDFLLDALDNAELIQEYNGEIDNKGIVTLYHATNKQAAEQIINSQTMYGKEDGIFFSTLNNGQISGYGNTIISVKIPLEKLILDDQFNNELHFKIECKPYEKIRVTAELTK
jgi:hypothetical protein